MPRRSPLRRVIRLGALFVASLLLAAVVSWGLAIGLSREYAPIALVQNNTGPSTTYWLRIVRFGGEGLIQANAHLPPGCEFQQVNSLGLRDTLAESIGMRAKAGYVADFAFGWPLPAFRWWMDANHTLPSYALSFGQGPHTVTANSTGFNYSSTFQFSGRYVLPLKPMWVNWCVNAMAYSFVLAMAGSLLAASKANRRRRRSLCSGCGYSLAGLNSEVCPECGAAVQDRLVVPEDSVKEPSSHER